MREAKFRAWEKFLKQMIPVDNIDFEQKMINTESAWRMFDEIEIMQYTGLKDKNGKEIYEGDICNCREYECFGKVEWNNEEAGFYFCVVMEGGGFEEEHLYDYVDELEVIGNIYENPELLVKT